MRKSIFVKLAILADDLTGACDTGIQFVEHGYQVHTRWQIDQLGLPTKDILAFSTTSRFHSAERAASHVRDAHLKIVQSGHHLIYKKIDSTLIGNIGAEIDAVLERGPHLLAVVCPAFPRMGRRFVHGELLLGDTGYRSGQHLPTMIRDQSTHHCVEVSLNEVRRSGSILLDRLRHAITTGTKVCCVDAEKETDLAHLAEALLALAPEVLPVGSAGLAAQLAKRFTGKTRNPSSLIDDGNIQTPLPENKINPPGSPIICFIGTTNPVTTQQLEQLKQHTELVSICLDNQTPQQLRSAIRRGQHMAIRIPWENNSPECWENIFTNLSAQTTAGLVLTGGDTAKTVCDMARVNGIDLQQQILPGLAKGCLIGGRLDGITVVTKAGGFGDNDTLVKVFTDLANKI